MMRYLKCFIVLTLLCLILSACETAIYIPEHGTWYCEELQAQLIGRGDLDADWNPTDNDDSGIYVIQDGDKIACTWGGQKGGTRFRIECMESDNEKYELGDVIYTLYFVSLDDDTYVLKDEAGKEYTFVRQE